MRIFSIAETYQLEFCYNATRARENVFPIWQTPEQIQGGTVMTLLGGGLRQWLAPLLLQLAMFALPASIWFFRTETIQSVIPTYVTIMAVLFGELIGSFIGLLLNSKAWLNTRQPWNRNSIVAGTGLITGLVMFYTYR